MNTHKKASRIVDLISKYFSDKLNPEEKKELDQWLSENDANQFFFNQLKDDDFILLELVNYEKLFKRYGKPPFH
jgi:hypothetical protein